MPQPSAFEIGNAVYVESFSGYALNRDGLSTTPFAVPVVDPTSGRANIALDSGTIRVWFSPDWSGANAGGKGPGDYARLLELVGLSEKKPEVVFSLYLNPEGTTIYFSGQGIGGATDYLTAPVRWQAGEWHLLSVSYNPKTSSLSVDGEEISTGGGVPEVASWKVDGLGLVVGTDLAAGNPAQGQFEELTTFDYRPDAEAQKFYFKGLSRQAWLGLVGTPEEEAAKWAALKAADGETLEEDGGGNGPMTMEYSSTDLWLEITAVSNSTQLAYLVIRNTVEDELYEILSAETLTNAWVSEGTVVGAAGQDWTPTTVPVLDRTNTLFFRARSLTYDTSGQGLPDWWQLENFGHIGVDPYDDPDNDGWSNIEEFQKGTDPNQFNTPPPPRAVRARLGVTGTNVVITWASGGGPVTQYEILTWTENGIQTNTVSASTFTFTDYAYYDDPEVPFDETAYQIRAYYTSGSPTASSWVGLSVASLDLNVQFFRGPGGGLYLAVASPPTNLFKIRIFQQESGFPHFDIYATNLVNGVGPLPMNQIIGQPGILHFQCFGTNGPFGSTFSASIFYSDDIVDPFGWPRTNFVNAAAHLKENLKFLLRSATTTTPFSYTSDLGTDWYTYDLNSDYVWLPEYYFARPSSPTAYEYSGFHVFSWSGDYSAMNELRPVHENYFWRNFVFNSGDFTSGLFDTGADFDILGQIRTLENAKYLYTGSGTESPLPLALTSTNSTWLYYRWFDSAAYDFDAAAEVGISLDSNTNLVLGANVHNVYGLSLNSLRAGSSYLITPGSIIPWDGTPYFPNFAVPQLQTVDYYFASQRRYLYYGDTARPPMPGSPDFTVTNTSPLLIASVGQPFTLAGWAKQEITNGYAGKYAYLEQYFDKAYKVGTNGVTSTNQTGVLSEYGEFFPTEAGPTALVTMPDIDTGQRGTGIVHVVSLSTDANHDGTIETSFAGPDFTSYFKPFRFWVNDDNDKDDTKGNDIPGYPATHKGTANGSDAVVGGVRDLLDFFPVFINIQSLLQTMSTNQIQAQYQFHLRQADSALNFIYTGLTLTNSHSYLTDTNVAATLAAATVNPVDSSGVPLLNGFLYGLRNEGKGIILAEGRANASNPLILEIWDGTNLVAETSLYLSITGVEQMFRQKNLIREVETNNAAGFADRVADSDVPNEPDTNGKNFVFLHGYNVNPDAARGSFAETFKRMYWSGSHAKFYGATYHGYESQWFGKVTPNLQTNIVNAFATAPKLADFLGTLTNETVVSGHSLGNMVVLSAINDWNARINKYFMIDAAVAVEALQGNTAQNGNMIHPDWNEYANRLTASEWHGLFPTNDYRSTLTWRDRLANLPITNIYNFYSSGEEVLREHVGLPPNDILETVAIEIAYYLTQQPLGIYTWAWQEKTKGRATFNGVLGSTHGGWGFNLNPPYFYLTNGGYEHMPNSQATLLSDSQLKTDPFFAMTSSNFVSDGALLGTSGSAYAQTNRDRILSDAIPSFTLPVGANSVPRLSPQGQPSRNFDMQALYENGWASGRGPVQVGAAAPGEWHHSDFREVAYTFTYKMFESLVDLGNLK